jgi:cytochrome o ubiquinol oxidase subunit 2
MAITLSPPARALYSGRTLRIASILAVSLLLSGCNWVVLNPAGDVARQQAELVEIATVLMLLIVVPVMLLICWFAWHYRDRAENHTARHEPNWNHSTQLELVIWSAPLLIIIALGAVTWVGTHLLDPYRTIGRISPTQAVAADARPLEVEVVALDWKWLFIYPEQKIATVNELVLPTNRPLRFRITSSSVMNSFYVPTMAGQIYAMPGMETKLHAVLNQVGNSTGFSANFSGAGFSQMRFAMRGVSPTDFDHWVASMHGAGTATLDHAAYLQLEKPSEKEPARHFAAVSPDLFDAVVNLCVRPGKMCMSQMMALDAKGGTGDAGRWNLASLTYDKFGREAETPLLGGNTTAATETFVKTLCATTIPSHAPSRDVLAPTDYTQLHGAGLPLPDAPHAMPANLSLAPAARSPLS